MERFNVEPDHLLRVIATPLLAVILVWATRNPYPIFAETRLTLVGVLAVVAILVAYRVLRSDGTDLGAGVIVATLVLVGTLLPTLLSSSPRVSMEWWILLGVPLAIYLLVAQGAVLHPLVSVFLAGLLLSLLALVGLVNQIVDWYSLMDDVAPEAALWAKLPVTLPRVGLYGVHPSLVAGVGAIVLPTGFALAKGKWRPVVLGSMVAVAAMVFVSGTRAGWLAGAVGLTVGYLVVRHERRVHSFRLVLVVAIVALVTAIALYVAGFRPEFLFRSTFGDRVPVMRAGWEMFRDAPVLGSGPGAVLWQIDSYLGDVYPGVNQRLVWVHAHNGYVQALAELGLVGCLFVLAALGLVVRSALQKARAKLDPRQSAAVLGGVAAFAVISIADAVVTGLSPLIVLAAVVGSGGHTSVGEKSGFGAIAKTTLVLLVLVPLLLVSWTLPATFVHESAVAAGSTDARHATDLHARAGELDGFIAYGRAEFATRARVDPELSATTSGALAAAPPVDASSVLNHLEVLTRNEPAEAATFLKFSADSMPAEEVMSLETARIAELLGLSELARDRAGFVLVMNPWMVDSPYWNVFSDENLRDEAIATALDRAPCSVISEFLLRDLPLEMMVSSASQCPDQSAASLTVRILSGEVDETLAVIRRGLASTPDDPVLRRLAGLGAWLNGDSVGARREWAVAAKLGDPYSALRLHQSYDRPPQSVRNVLVANLVGYSPVIAANEDFAYRFGSSRYQAVYRRAFPWSVLVSAQWVHATSGLHLDILADLGVER